MLEGLVDLGHLGSVERVVGDGQGAKRRLAEAIDRGQDLGSSRAGQLLARCADPFVRAARQQYVGGALGDHRDLALSRGVGFDAAHELALGGERHLTDAREAGGALLGDAELALRHEERCVGGIALDRPGPVVVAKDRVVGQAPSAQHDADLLEQRPVVRQFVAECDLAFGLVADAGHRHLTGMGDDALDRHLVLGQRARLVGADDRGGAQGLDRRQLLDDGAPAGHASHAESEDDGQDGRQSLGHGRDGQRYAEQQDLHEVARLLDVGRQHDRPDDHDRDDDHRDAERPADPIDLPLERRALLLGALEEGRDATHLGAHPGRGHHRATAAPGHGRPAEHHVHAVAQRRRCRKGRGVLGDRLALAGQRRLGNDQRCRLDQAGVRADGVALAQDEEVAGHDVGGRDADLPSVPNHAGGRRGHPLQRRHRLLRLPLLHEPQHGVRDDDDGDHDRLERRALRALERPGHDGDDDGCEQQVDERVGELGQELPPGRHLGRGIEAIGADACEAVRSLSGREPGRRVAAQRPREVGDVND
jgi:hypothetical protein